VQLGRPEDCSRERSALSASEGALLFQRRICENTAVMKTAGEVHLAEIHDASGFMAASVDANTTPAATPGSEGSEGSEGSVGCTHAPVHAQAREVVARGAQRDGLADGGRARLEAAGRLGEGGVVEEDVRDHLAAAHVRLHRLHHVVAPPQKPDARRRAHLVARRHDPVRAQRLSNQQAHSVEWDAN
jgi:hypothetical protein